MFAVFFLPSMAWVMAPVPSCSSVTSAKYGSNPGLFMTAGAAAQSTELFDASTPSDMNAAVTMGPFIGQKNSSEIRTVRFRPTRYFPSIASRARTPGPGAGSAASTVFGSPKAVHWSPARCRDRRML